MSDPYREEKDTVNVAKLQQENKELRSDVARLEKQLLERIMKSKKQMSPVYLTAIISILSGGLITFWTWLHYKWFDDFEPTEDAGLLTASFAFMATAVAWFWVKVFTKKD